VRELHDAVMPASDSSAMQSSFKRPFDWIAIRNITVTKKVLELQRYIICKQIANFSNKNLYICNNNQKQNQ
jgi:hypothetical protein